MAYFCIMSGLRGCYMPDSAYVVQCDTRRALKSVLESEARQIGESYAGLSKRSIQWAAAKAWRERKCRTIYALAVLPYGNGKERPFALEVATATRQDYLDQGESV